jgi:hypothetical protein
MQSPLTVITPIRPSDCQPLKTLLLDIGGDIKRNPHIDFTRATSTHFCRWVIFDENTPKPQLLFNANFDGAVDDYIRALPGWLGDTLDEIWGRCEGYPNGRKTTPETFAEHFLTYLKRHSYPVPVFFRAYFGRTVQEVRQAQTLRKALRELLNTDASAALSPLLNALPIIPEKEQRNWNPLGGIAGALLGGIGGVLQRIMGSNTLKYDPDKPSKIVRHKLEFTEREIVQNELTILAPLKPGRVGWTQFMLPIVGYFSNPPYTSNGKLSDMTTIHFARWVVIDGINGGKRMLFESNYDGSWEKYIDDFIDHAWQGLDTIFGNCYGYPEGGSRTNEPFKQAILDHQLRAQTFYSAYPDTTVRNIINDLAIYDGLRRALGEKRVIEWLRRL